MVTRRAEYIPLGPLGSGGMATVHLGRMRSPVGFTRLVAIKQLHEHLAADPEIVSLLLEEARISSAVYHPNVASTLEVVVAPGSVSLVQEYVEGVSLSALLRRARARTPAIRMPVPVAITIAIGVLRGLGATHEATNARGEPLHVIHRDVSPQNVLVGADGSVRLIDFGIARAMGRAMMTAPNVVSGKLPYMAPEQVLFRPVTNQVDLHALGVVLWEMLTGQRLIGDGSDDAMAAAVLGAPKPPPSTLRSDVCPELDRIVLRALAPSLSERYSAAEEIEADLARLAQATPREVGEIVRDLAADELLRRRKLVADHAAGDAVPPRDDVLAEIRSGVTSTIEPICAPAETARATSSAGRRTSTFLVIGSTAATVAAIVILLAGPRLATSRSSASAPVAESLPVASVIAAAAPAAIPADPREPAPFASAERRTPAPPRAPPRQPARREPVRRTATAPAGATSSSAPSPSPSHAPSTGPLDPREYP
jgi:eukaryotic-like serine/threonine-protein kinase